MSVVPEEGRRSAASRIAAAITVTEALVLLGLGVFYGYETASGAASDATGAVSSGLLILVFAALLAVLARGWVQGADWARTPTVLWNALLLPVAWSLLDSGRAAVAAALAAAAVVGIVAAMAAPSRSAAGREDLS